jgi:hypothetical protein
VNRQINRRCKIARLSTFWQDCEVRFVEWALPSVGAPLTAVV